VVDGLVISYLEPGNGDRAILLHGGEYGVSAEIGWERNIAVLAAHFVGNSMGAIMVLTDTTSESPVLPARGMVIICGRGEIRRNRYMDALYGYDMATMRRHRRCAAS
jgi:hypothetical protein